MAGPLPEKLRVSNLTFAYRLKEEPVLTGLSHAFASGAMTAVTGASGSGKSTLLYVLGLMLKVGDGQLFWDGEDTGELNDGDRSALRAANVGFVFQDAMLDPAISVLDNACESGVFAGIRRPERERRARALLAQFGVSHRASHRPGEISGGQAQRVALCRALLTDPEVILGDEPTGNLDSESAAIVWGALSMRAREGATVVVATHDERLAATADERLVL